MSTQLMLAVHVQLPREAIRTVVITSNAPNPRVRTHTHACTSINSNYRMLFTTFPFVSSRSCQIPDRLLLLMRLLSAGMLPCLPI